MAHLTKGHLKEHIAPETFRAEEGVGPPARKLMHPQAIPIPGWAADEQAAEEVRWRASRGKDESMPSRIDQDQARASMPNTVTMPPKTVGSRDTIGGAHAPREDSFPMAAKGANESTDPGMWTQGDQSLQGANGIVEKVIFALTGKSPSEPMLALMNEELQHVAHEGRVQSLVMEMKRHQTGFGVKLVQQLHQDALSEFSETMQSIKHFEQAQDWAETETERAEVESTVVTMRSKAREQLYKSLDMGARRIDEQLDRPLHLSDPDFPQRPERLNWSRSLLQRIFYRIRWKLLDQ